MAQSLPAMDTHQIAIGIVGHTARREAAEHLAHQLDADVLSIDDGTLGSNRNHHKVWTALAHSPTPWALVLEDDAQPVDRFLKQLGMALTAAPAPIVSLYLGTSRPASWQTRIQKVVTRADQADACYITATHLLHAVAVAIHTELITDMLNHLTPDKPIDNAITQWAHNQHHTIAYTWPSLVNHNDGPTLVKHTYNPHNQPRKAWRTATRNTWHNTTATI